MHGSVQLAAVLLILVQLNQCPKVESVTATTQASLEQLNSGPASKFKRSAPVVAIGSSKSRTEVLELRFKDKSKVLEINERNELGAQARVAHVPANAMDIYQVLDPVTHQRLNLPIDSVIRPPANEYKFLIRGHFNHRYICMNSQGLVHTVVKDNGKLPEDCLWRGLILPMISPGMSIHQKVVFYQAFYPESHDNSTARTRWYLGFRPSDYRPARGGELKGSSRRVQFSAYAYQPSHDLQQQLHDVINANKTGASGAADSQLVQIGDKPVKLSNSSLAQSANNHVANQFATEDCSRAKAMIESLTRERKQRISGVMSQLGNLRKALRRRAEQAGVSESDIRSGERALKGYLRDVTHHFLYNRGRCVHEELAVTFQSVEIANLIKSSESRRLCRRVRKPSGVRAHKRRFRRHQRLLRQFFRKKLGVRVDNGGDVEDGGGVSSGSQRRRHGSRRSGSQPQILDLFRTVLNVSLPSMRSIQEARLWRRVKKQALASLASEAVNAMDSQLRPAYRREKLHHLETRDAAEFILLLNSERTPGKIFTSTETEAEFDSEDDSKRSLVRHGRGSNQRHSLVSRVEFEELRRKYANFPLFYFHLQCSRLAH